GGRPCARRRLLPAPHRRRDDLGARQPRRYCGPGRERTEADDARGPGEVHLAVPIQRLPLRLDIAPRDPEESSLRLREGDRSDGPEGTGSRALTEPFSAAGAGG